MVNSTGANPVALDASHAFGLWEGFFILCGYTVLLLVGAPAPWSARTRSSVDE